MGLAFTLIFASFTACPVFLVWTTPFCAHARGTLADVLPKVESASQSVLRDAIRHERRVELALEPDRFYDLVRWGIAKEVLQAAGKNYQDKNALLPLPQTEIDKSNGVLVQNPDY